MAAPTEVEGAAWSALRAVAARLRAALAAEQRHGRLLESENSQLVTQHTADAADLTRTGGEHRREVAGLRTDLSDGRAKSDLATGLHQRGLRREWALRAQLLLYGRDLARLYRRWHVDRSGRVHVLLVALLVALAFVAGVVARPILG